MRPPTGIRRINLARRHLLLMATHACCLSDGHEMRLETFLRRLLPWFPPLVAGAVVAATVHESAGVDRV